MYFLRYQGQNHGPYALDQVRSMWASGIITADAVYWVEVESVWKPIAKLLATGRTEGASIPEPASVKQQPGPSPAPSAPPPANDSQRDAPSKAFPFIATTGPKGVGGWLVVFALLLTILAPVLCLYGIDKAWSNTEKAFARFPVLKNAMMWESACTVTIVIYGFVVGWRILDRNPNGRKFAMQFLQIRFLGFVGTYIGSLSILNGLPKSIMDASIHGAIESLLMELVFIVVWWFYFKNSKRVRNTYGDETHGIDRVTTDAEPAPRRVSDPGTAPTSPTASPTFYRRTGAFVGLVVVGFFAFVAVELSKNFFPRNLLLLVVAGAVGAAVGVFVVELFRIPIREEVSQEDSSQTPEPSTAPPAKPKSYRRLTAIVTFIVVAGCLLFILEEISDADRSTRQNAKRAGVSENSSAHGDAQALFNLGGRYFTGDGVPKDEAKAAEYYAKAADHGEAGAQAMLGWMYLSGRGVSKDEEKAIEWLQKAATQGNASAQSNLAAMYLHGNAVPRDDVKSFEWYEKAAAQGEPFAQNTLGWAYENGRGVTKDEAKAVEWYRKAAAQGNAAAQTALGYAYSNGNGVKRDYPKAIELYEGAAAQGYAVAQAELGLMYENGKGVPKNATKAFELQQHAATQGNAVAQSNLGNIYFFGKGIQKDAAKAAEWYQKAADQGYAQAQYNLGVMYFNGTGVPKDERKAIEWYQKAAAQGDPHAQAALKNRK